MEKLKELRKQQRKTQEEIANFLNVNKMTYCNYENENRKPNLETLIKLADYFNVSLDYLVDRNWSNDLGLITKEQLDLFKMIKKLSLPNFYVVQGYVLRLLQEQV